MPFHFGQLTDPQWDATGVAKGVTFLSGWWVLPGAVLGALVWAILLRVVLGL